ncbi:MAG: hypothetical protein JWL83_571, partial [Actinomycetia bacterium]|nr:hypothetical protein [Actinomycetes bacterium]
MTKTAEELRIAAVPWVLARVLVLGALALTRHVVTTLPVSPRPLQAHQGLFAWDAAFYRDIAHGGYDAVPKLGLRFFPLVPLLGRLVGLLPGVSTDIGVLVVVNASALVAGVLIVRLVRNETGDMELARRAAWLIALAPPAFVAVMGYAEATLMALALAMALALRSQRWGWAILFGYLAGLARPVGVLLVAFALVAVWIAKAPRARVLQVAAVCSPVAGLFSYLLWVRNRTGDLFYAFHAQENPHLRGTAVNPIANIDHATRELFSGDRFGSGLHAITLLVLVVLLVVLVRSWPWPYTAYAFAAL